MSAFATAPSSMDRPCADALDVLAHSHEQTRALAAECRRFSRHVGHDRNMQGVAETLCGAIHRLAALEEELVYPVARQALGAPSPVDLAAVEHATARQIIRRMQLTDPCSACYEALVVALADCVERHACHEQAQLFPRLRESTLDLAALGARLSARQHELETST